MHGGREQQMPPHAAAIPFAFPASSYVPTIRTGVGYRIVFAPTDFFMVFSFLIYILNIQLVFLIIVKTLFWSHPLSS